MTAVPETTDPVAGMLVSKILEGIASVVEANKTLLAADEGAAGVREIDKALKDFIPSETNDVSEKDEEVVKAVKQLESARKAFKTAQEKARNAYRVNILHEEEVEEKESDVDSDAVKAQRKLVMEAVTLLKSYAELNKLPELVKWSNALSVPQVGRQGSSSVGQRKPRAYVTVDDNTHNSFGEAAKALSTLLSTDDNKVEVTSNDLVVAWDEASTDSFDFQGHTVRVAEKEKKAAA